MAQVKITDLPNALPLTGFESVPIVQNGVTVQTTTGAISVQPSQTQTFLTATQQPSLPNSRYLTAGSGLDVVDNGAGGSLQINLTGAAASLGSVGNGFLVKTDASTLTPRLFEVGTGLGITNASGIDGNPLISLGSFLANFQSLSGSTGLVGVKAGNISSLAINGTSGNISVANQDGSTGNPTINLVSTGTSTGTFGSSTTIPVVTVDTFGRITNVTTASAVAGGTVTQINTGTGLTGGPITMSGTISIDNTVVATLTDTQTLTNKSISGSTNTLTNVGNSSLTNSTISGVALGSNLNTLTIGTGLSGTSYNGSAPTTISITNLGSANGVATLDSGGTVPLSQIPASLQGGVSYQGTWNASTNTPTLTSSVGTKGYYYVVNVAGSTNLNGITDWQVGDWVIFNGSVWQKIDNTDAVTSVNGYTGTVVLTASNIGGLGTMAVQNANNVAVTGGAIDNTVIGGTTPAAGTFTTLIGGKDKANYGQLTGGTTTNAVQFQTLGSDTNISYAIQPKGTGAIDLAAGSNGVNISNGGTVTAITGTTGGSYTTVPTITISAPTTVGGVQATGTVGMASGTITLAGGGSGYAIGDTITLTGGTFSQAIVLTVATLSGSAVATFTTTNAGTYTVLPTNPISQGSTSGAGTGATFNVTSWQVRSTAFTITNAGSGYVEQPTITFSSGTAAAYATIGSGTIVKSLGQTVSFYTPQGELLRLQDAVNGQTGNYLQVSQTTGNDILLSAQGTSASPSIYIGAKGTTGGIRFTASGTGIEQMRISPTASAVNYIQATGGVTTGYPTISSQGSDTSTGLYFQAKGTTGSIRFSTNASNSNEQFRVSNTASAVNYLNVTGSATTLAPVFSTAGTDTNISMVVQPKGTGAFDIAAGSSGVNISNGGTVTAITKTAGGTYTTVPTITISAPTTAGGVQATAAAVLGLTTGAVTIAGGGTGYTAGDTLTVVGGTFTSAATITVSTVSGGVITAAVQASGGAYTALPTNPVSVTGGTGTGATFTLNYTVGTPNITNAGSGYVEQPTVTFSSGTAAAYATVGSGTVVRSIGSTMSFYTPGGEQARVQDVANSANYVKFLGAAAGGGPSVDFNGSDATVIGVLTAKGTNSALSFAPNYVQQMRVTSTASAVNYVQVTGAATSAIPTISAQGSDSAISLNINGKGGASLFFSNNGGNTTSFRVNNTTSSVNYPQVTGGVTGSGAVYGVAGTDTNIDLTLTPKGTGVVNAGTNFANYHQLLGSATTVGITHAAQGSDANIDFIISPKGAGKVVLTNGIQGGSF